MRLSFSLLFFFALVIFSWPATARARALEYRAPEGCPSRDDLAARINARAPKGRDARINVERVKDGFHGEVVLGGGGNKGNDNNNSRLARSVDARTCNAVIEALTLVVALDRDEPTVNETSEEALPATATAPATAPSPVSAPPNSPVHDDDADGARSDAPPSLPPREEKQHAVIALGAGLSINPTFLGASTKLDNWISELRLFADLAPSRPLFGTTWRPSARASFARSLPYYANHQIGSVRPELVVTTGALDLCPQEAFRKSYVTGANTGAVSVSANGCSRTEIGIVEARDANDDASTKSRLWLSTGLALRTRLEFGAGRVRLIFEHWIGFSFPLIRPRFHFPTYAEPIVANGMSSSVGIAAGVVFP